MPSQRPTNRPAGEKKANRRGPVELPGVYASKPSWLATTPPEQLACLTDADRELLSLAAAVSDCAESTRSLILGESDYMPPDVEAAKGVERRRMQRMLLAWFGLRPESEPPYRDARMLLTACILEQAGFLRALRDGTGASSPGPAAEDAIVSMGVAHTASLVAALYPTLALAMRDAHRLVQIRAAIEAAATTDKRTPWTLIAAVWTGIGKGELAPETWRQDWDDYQHSHRR
jgi:hypothetical protein